MIRILHIDDSPQDILLTRLNLEALTPDVKVIPAESAEEALTLVANQTFDCILCDYMLPGMDGLELLQAVRRIGVNIPFIYLTGQGSEEFAKQAFREGAADYWNKSADADSYERLLTRISRLIAIHQERIERRRTEELLRQSEERFRTLVSSIDDMVFTLDKHGRFQGLYGNWLNKYGFNQQSFVGKTIEDIFEQENTNSHRAALEDALNGDTVTYEWSFRIKGVLNYFHTSFSPLKNALGEIVGVVGIGRNITEIMQKEAELRDSEERYRSVVDNFDGVAYRYDAGMRPILLRGAVFDITGYRTAHFFGRNHTWNEIVHIEDQEQFLNAHNPSPKKLEAGHDISYRLIHRNGDIRWVRQFIKGTYDTDGSLLYFQGSLYDITKSKEDEERIRTLSHLRKVRSEINQAIVRTSDRAMLLLHVCRIIVESGGFNMAWVGSWDRFSKKIMPEASWGDNSGYLKDLISRLQNDPKMTCPTLTAVQQCEPQLFNIDDHARKKDPWNNLLRDHGYSTVSSFPLFVEGNVSGSISICSTRKYHLTEEYVQQFVEIADDLTFALTAIERDKQRQDALEALKESEKQYRYLFESSGDAIFIYGLDGEILEVNDAALERLEYERGDLMRMRPQDFTSIRYAPAFEKRLTELLSKDKLIYETEHVTSSGTIIPSEISSRLIEYHNRSAILDVVRDITERKDAERKEKLHQQQLAQTSKMASLGILVAGVAHEINNPNHFIMSNVEYLRSAWSSVLEILDEDAEKMKSIKLGGIPYNEARELITPTLEGIRTGSDRIKKIVQELRDFARQSPMELTESVDINSVVSSATILLSNLIKKSTYRFVENLGRSIPPLPGNFQRLEQVVINLLTNACQALTDREQEIQVRTAHDPEKKLVILQVIDQGSGIDEQHLAHIADPFFTTKRTAGGTGLGLSISSKVIEEHGGELHFSSEKGVGTTVTVSLPIENHNSDTAIRA